MHQVEIRTIEPLVVASVRHQGPYNDIGEAFQALFDWALERRLLAEGTRVLGLFLDDPAEVAPEALRSLACMTLPDGAEPSGYVRPATIPGGRYAVVRHQGHYDKLPAIYAWLRGEWLPASGEQVDDRPCVEDYLNDPAYLDPKEWLTEVYVPLKG